MPEVAESPMREFVAAGWKFSYDPETRFVEASHPLGGRFRLCEVLQMTRNGIDKPIMWDEVGRAIAVFLSQE